VSTFGDLQNGLLQRCRQTGVNWGGTPTNTATSLLPPYRVQFELNQAYNRALAICKDFQIATLEVSFLTTLNTRRFSLNPIPTSTSAQGTFKEIGNSQTGTNYSLPSPPKQGDTVVIIIASAGSLAAVTVTDSAGTALTQEVLEADPSTTNSIALYDYVVGAGPTTGNFVISGSVNGFAVGYKLGSVGTGTFGKANGTSSSSTITEAGVAIGALQIAGLISQTAGSPSVTLSNGSQTYNIQTSLAAVASATAGATASSTAVIAGAGLYAGFYAYYPAQTEVIYNPCAMQIYEYKYTQNGTGQNPGQTRYITFGSDAKYRAYTAGYNQVNSSFSAFPDILRQSFGQRLIDAFPGYATTGDTITLTICPDPYATSQLFTNAQIPCSRGNIMSAISDVPLLPAQYHPVILAGAILQIAPDLDKVKVSDDAQKIWDAFVQEMDDFGSSLAEGDAQQQVIDTWSAFISPELSVM